MDNPLHAPYFADHAVHSACSVLENVLLARDTYRLRMECPALARRILPGQFVMLRLPGCDDPLIGRPFALYDVVATTPGAAEDAIDIVYLVAGKLTTRMARLLPGQSVEVWGPLGNGFLPQSCDHLLMVAGGIGQTPFLAVAQEHLGLKQYGHPRRQVKCLQRVTLCYGVRTQDMLAGVEDFRRLGVQVHLSTDDGSCGHHGLVSDLVSQTLAADLGTTRIVCCGPEPMMHAVARLAAQADVPCQVSLETPMACGIGICFSCVARIKDDAGQWDYRRTCVAGPVFDADVIAWE